MKNIILLFLLASLNLAAQTDTKYLNYSYEQCRKKYAAYTADIFKEKDSVIKKIKALHSNELVAIYKYHKKNKDFVYAINYRSDASISDEGLLINSKKNGEWIYYANKGIIEKKTVFKNDTIIAEKYFESGLITLDLPYSQGRYNGECKVYNKNGEVVKKVFFENGIKIKTEDLFGSDSLNKSEIYYTQVMPTFIGGDAAMYKFISDNVNYPKKAMNAGVQGRVIVEFKLDSIGNITEVKLLSKDKVGYGCDEEAMRVIRSMPRWNPGMQNGKPVNVYFNLPITFRLF